MSIDSQDSTLSEITKKLRLALEHKDQTVELESLDPITRAQVRDQEADTELKNAMPIGLSGYSLANWLR